MSDEAERIARVDGHLARQLSASIAENARLRGGIRAIMRGTETGAVGGEDVVWFDTITTLWEHCDWLLNEKDIPTMNTQIDVLIEEAKAFLNSRGVIQTEADRMQAILHLRLLETWRFGEPKTELPTRNHG